MKTDKRKAETKGRLAPWVPFLFVPLLASKIYAAAASLDIISTLTATQTLLAHVGPLLSAVMFIISGIFFALAQLFPTYKRASLHSTAADILVGAIIVAVLSVASNGLAIASTHLLMNSTNSM
ncbi:MAG: hypothetical protein ACP5MC_01330 [Candidatus Micrarchaeia archaeon]